MNDDPNPIDEPPLVTPVEVYVPPWKSMNLGWALLWTLGFAGVLFGTLFGVAIVGGVILALSGNPALNGPAAPGQLLPPVLADILAVGVVVAYGAALLYALIAFRVVVGRGWTREIGLRRLPLRHVLLAIVLLPGFMIASDVIGDLFVALFGNSDEFGSDQVLRDLFPDLPLWYAVFAIGICPGVVEELWCRGFLGRGLVRRYGWILGVLFTSAFFGLLHGWPPARVLTTACMGVGLHLVYIASRSLWVSMLIHTLNNGIAVLTVLGNVALKHAEQNANANPTLTILLGLGLLVFAGVAMGTGRVRVVPADPELPVWRPAFPGVAPPPPGANAVLRPGRMSPVALVLALGTFAALIYLLFR